jgi:hypothetical protein
MGVLFFLADKHSKEYLSLGKCRPGSDRFDPSDRAVVKFLVDHKCGDLVIGNDTPGPYEDDDLFSLIYKEKYKEILCEELDPECR